MDFGPQQVGKMLVVFGIVITVVGLIFWVFGRFGLFRLPGDLEFGLKSWKFFFPLASCIIISIILTVILWIISLFRR